VERVAPLFITKKLYLHLRRVRPSSNFEQISETFSHFLRYISIKDNITVKKNASFGRFLSIIIVSKEGAGK
jgi:hypothetical protein